MLVCYVVVEDEKYELLNGVDVTRYAKKSENGCVRGFINPVDARKEQLELGGLIAKVRADRFSPCCEDGLVIVDSGRVLEFPTTQRLDDDQNYLDSVRKLNAKYASRLEKMKKHA